MNLEAILNSAVDVAREAGALVRASFGNLQEMDFKGAVNPVTAVDRRAESLILERLREIYPDHHVLAEEEGGDPLHTSAPLWLIDPLDGTNNFAHGFPHVGLSLALLVEGDPKVGVVYDPLRDELFTATREGGSSLNGGRIHVSQVEQLAEAFLSTGFPYARRILEDNNTQRLDHFLRRSLGVRRAGAAVLDLAYVACGRLDGHWEPGLKPWDVGAGLLLVEEAGGRVTDFGGEPLPVSGDTIVASNGHIHAAMLQVIREGAAAPHPDRDPEAAL
ncbi:MAG: inositol monophosphatase family protein [Anaerolineales bacterium]